MNDKIEQRARELLAAEYESDGLTVLARDTRDGYRQNTRAMRAIANALREQSPERNAHAAGPFVHEMRVYSFKAPPGHTTNASYAKGWNDCRAAMLAAAPKPEAQAAGDGVTFWLIVRNGDVEFGQDLADLPTPASHDAQQRAVDGEWMETVDRIVPAMDAVPEKDDERCCEWAVWNDRERIRRELIALAQQPAVVGDGVRPFAWYRPRDDQEPEFRTSPPPAGHGWLPVPGFTTYAKLDAALAPAATPGDGGALLRIALADAYSHGEKHAPFAMEDCVRKVMAAQKEGNGNG